ncbi:MAG: EF-Tu/IF-2/RF-3 family GTPase, partial [Gemmatimonadaceae bacterium]
TNFGVEPFLHEFLELAPPPRPRESSIGIIEPTNPAFTGFVFKIQANMDPRHRDRVAFLRVCSGMFEAGMQVKQVRTGKSMRLSSPQQFMARERSAIEVAWPGDVIGVLDRGNLRIGDTLSGGGDLEFQGIPRFVMFHLRTTLVKICRQFPDLADVDVGRGRDAVNLEPRLGLLQFSQCVVGFHRLFKRVSGAPKLIVKRRHSVER